MSKPGTLLNALLCITSLSPHSSVVKQIQLFSLFYKNRKQARRRHMFEVYTYWCFVGDRKASWEEKRKGAE